MDQADSAKQIPAARLQRNIRLAERLLTLGTYQIIVFLLYNFLRRNGGTGILPV